MDLTVKGNISTGIVPHADFRSKWCMEGQKLKNNKEGLFGDKKGRAELTLPLVFDYVCQINY